MELTLVVSGKGGKVDENDKEIYRRAKGILSGEVDGFVMIVESTDDETGSGNSLALGGHGMSEPEILGNLEMMKVKIIDNMGSYTRRDRYE